MYKQFSIYIYIYYCAMLTLWGYQFWVLVICWMPKYIVIFLYILNIKSFFCYFHMPYVDCCLDLWNFWIYLHCRIYVWRIWDYWCFSPSRPSWEKNAFLLHFCRYHGLGFVLAYSYSVHAVTEIFQADVMKDI